MNRAAAYAALAQLGAELRADVPLARYTVARLGGPADRLVEARDPDQLVKWCRAAWEHAIPVRIIGSAANVLFSDDGYRGLIIVNRATRVAFDGDQPGVVACESGVNLPQLARETIARGIGGFGWAIGVPGTVGGAVVNNAGAHGADMAANIVSADVFFADRGLVRVPADALGYQYRESALKHSAEKFAVLGAVLAFPDHGQDPATLRAIADDYQAKRRASQPNGASLGSMFKNPPGDYAGRLIEVAGLKGTQVGGVVISPVHANFFVNTGGGTAADYLALIRLAQKAVADRFGVALALEIELIGESGELPSGDF